MINLKRIFILFIFIFGMFKINFVYATNEVSLIDDISNFNANVSANVVNKTSSLREIVGKFLGFLRIVSGFLLVIMLGITGYRYVVATPDVKAIIKKEGIMVILGLILVFGAVSISQFIVRGMGR